MSIGRFEKWQALGNDYLIVESDELPFALTRARARGLCNQHFGVGADGVLLLSRAENPKHVAELRIFNPDGSEAELSGNGAREAVLYLRRRGWTDRDEFAIGTAAGEIRPRITGVDMCTVDMGRASLTSKDYPGGAPDGRGELGAGGRTWRFRHVSIGNPQCAIHVNSEAALAGLDLAEVGTEIEGHELFPNRTNVSWYTEVDGGNRLTSQLESRSISPPEHQSTALPESRHNSPPEVAQARRIRARIFERGVGETLSSGTGATGAAVAYVQEHGGDRRGAGVARVTVVLDGGELEVEVGEGLSVNLTGWARPVYEGRLSDELVKELEELKEIDETE